MEVLKILRRGPICDKLQPVPHILKRSRQSQPVPPIPAKKAANPSGSGRVEAAKKPPTIYEIAKVVGVSGASVSRVLCGITGKRGKKREEVLEAARRMGYNPNRAARNLVSQRSHLLGFLASDLSNPAYVTYYHAIENFFRPRGFEILIGDSERSGEIEASNISRMLGSRVEGLFIFPVSDWDVGLTKTCEASYSGIGVPTVTLGQPVPGRMDRVYPDEAGMAGLMARHLDSHGHRRCLFLLSDQGVNPTASERFRAFAKAFSGPRHKVLSVDFESPGWQETCVEEIKTNRFTAVVGVSHLHAAWFYRAAREHGLRIPQDVSVAAFDDGVASEFLNPELTCTRIDHLAGAARAAAFLLARLESRHPPAPPTRFTIPGKLIVRNSVAKAR